MIKYSIVIPNWNGQRFLKACFDSIERQTYSEYEVLMVDNGSVDDSIKFTEKNYPKVKIIKLPENIGFSPAVNIGIKAAQNDYIFLLNNDTELDKNFLAETKKGIEQHPEAGFFATKMLDFKNHAILDSCGDGMSWSGRFYNIGSLEKDGQKYDDEKFVFGACGGAAIYKKEVFESIGYFDSDFFAYVEDVDISFRAQLAGFQCLFIPAARVYHIGSATTGKKSGFSFKMMIKNHFHLIYKNYPTRKLLSNFGKLTYNELRLILTAGKNGFIKEYFWGAYRAFLEYPKMRPKRGVIQHNIKVSVKYLDQIIDKTYHYGKTN